MLRFARPLLMVALVLVVLPSAAHAKKPKPFPKLPSIDKSFGGTGRVPLARLTRFPTSLAGGVRCSAGPNGGIYAALTGVGLKRKKQSGLKVFARSAKGRPIASFGRRGLYEDFNFQGYIDRIVSSMNGSLYVIGVTSRGLNIIRLNRRGELVDRFGGKGSVTVREAKELIGADSTPDGGLALWFTAGETARLMVLDNGGRLNRDFGGTGQIEFPALDLVGNPSARPLDVDENGRLLISGTVGDLPGDGKLPTEARVRAFNRQGAELSEVAWKTDVTTVPDLVKSRFAPSDSEPKIRQVSAAWLNDGGVGVAVSGWGGGTNYVWSTHIASASPFGFNGIALTHRPWMSLTDQSWQLMDELQIIRPDGRVVSGVLNYDIAIVRSTDSEGMASSPENRAAHFSATSMAQASGTGEYLCGFWRGKETIVKIKLDRYPFRYEG